MTRVTQFLTPDRMAAGVASAVGWTVGIQITQGGFDQVSAMWAGIAVLGLVQLRLLLPSKAKTAA